MRTLLDAIKHIKAYYHQAQQYRLVNILRMLTKIRREYLVWYLRQQINYDSFVVILINFKLNWEYTISKMKSLWEFLF